MRWSGKGWLLISALIIVTHLDLSAESILFSLSSANRKASLTHTVFQGTGRRYNTISDLERRDDFSLAGTNFNQQGWKYRIATTLFWIGEQATENNPVSNVESAWDVSWVDHYGGEDDPIQRANFIPMGFIPKLNPFYVALPYNDVDDHHTKPEAARVVPWFNAAFVRDGQSVCKGRWIAIRHGMRTCYAQWEDVGPFQVDHWQYVFGGERPRPNRNSDAGLDVSPAVRDYLEMAGIDYCDWRFVSVIEVPDGPWAMYGDNNTAVHLRSQLKRKLPKQNEKLPRTQAKNQTNPQ